MRAIQNALHQRQQRQYPNIHVTQRGQQSEHQHIDDADRVNQDRGSTPVKAIREYAENRTKHHRGSKLGRRDDANPQLGVCQFPGKPAQRHAVDPQSVQGNRVAGQVEKEISVAQR
jgi:hypothetical protein